MEKSAHKHTNRDFYKQIHRLQDGKTELADVLTLLLVDHTVVTGFPAMVDRFQCLKDHWRWIAEGSLPSAI